MSTELTDPIDELCQIGDGLRVVWLALNGIAGFDGHHEITSFVGSLDDRLHAVIEDMIGDDVLGRSE